MKPIVLCDFRVIVTNLKIISRRRLSNSEPVLATRIQVPWQDSGLLVSEAQAEVSPAVPADHPSLRGNLKAHARSARRRRWSRSAGPGPLAGPPEGPTPVPRLLQPPLPRPRRCLYQAPAWFRLSTPSKAVTGPARALVLPADAVDHRRLGSGSHDGPGATVPGPVARRS